MSPSEQRLADGKCKFCDNPLKTSKLCEEHAKQAVEVQRRMFKSRKEAGKCTICGANRGGDGTETMCARHAGAMRRNAKNGKERRKAAGQCRQCPNKIAKDKSKVFCVTCLEKHRSRYRKKK